MSEKSLTRPLGAWANANGGYAVKPYQMSNATHYGLLSDARVFLVLKDILTSQS